MKIFTKDLPFTDQRQPEQLGRIAATNGKAFCKAMHSRFAALGSKAQKLLVQFDTAGALSKEDVGKISGMEKVWTALASLEDEMDTTLRANNISLDSDQSSNTRTSNSEILSAIEKHVDQYWNPPKYEIKSASDLYREQTAKDLADRVAAGKRAPEPGK